MLTGRDHRTLATVATLVDAIARLSDLVDIQLDDLPADPGDHLATMVHALRTGIATLQDDLRASQNHAAAGASRRPKAAGVGTRP